VRIKIEVSPVSGFPMEWVRKYCVDGEYDCSFCKHEGDQDWCVECMDYGDSFSPKETEATNGN